MPPLSAYTPFESLLFFQSLAALDARPASFATISDVLRNNPFIRQNAAFDAGRLAPEALEDLYTTLVREGVDSIGVVAAHESNGRHAESPINPKKRKITSPQPDGSSEKGLSHTSLMPTLVSHLYARYKELVTREIRNDEKRYTEIRNEIELLQKEEREAQPESIVRPPPQPVAPPKQEHAPEPMDLDVKEERPPQQPMPASIQSKPPPPVVDRAQAQPVPQSKDLQPDKQPPKTMPYLPQTPSQLPKQPAGQSLKEPVRPIQPQPQQLQPTVQPPPPIPQMATGRPPQPQTPNGKTFPAPQANTVPRNVPAKAGAAGVTFMSPQVPPPNITSSNLSAGKPPAPMQPQIVPKAISTPQQSTPVDKPAAKAGAPTTASTPIPQRLPPQSSFQQWSLHQPPQTPQPSPSLIKPKPEPSNNPPLERPVPPFQQPIPSVESKLAQQGQPPIPFPSTPGPVPAAASSPALGVPAPGFQTPVGTGRAALIPGPPDSRPLRPSVDTIGSLTPWKRTPRLSLSIPESPRSPDRPRPEEISPISEKAPSPPGSREATPEEPEPRRLKRRTDRKGNSTSSESNQPAVDADTKPGSKRKVDKLTPSTGKDRDRSTASSRSRGRSVLSRDDESTTESGSQPKVKHEMPSTPAGVPEMAEPERPSISRPGRGRPKRKRAPSEEAEPPQTEASQLTRLDPNQSTPYVLCARSFPRTGAPIMNDVTMHKHASIFAKPLAERDAPGYRDLIYRPQDLKSIKSVMYQGSKAVAAATEAASTPAADGESPAPGTGTPSKNAVLMLQKTEDVIPPKGIVNSAQLEKELIRMFANAVMFNPVPQRGFGPGFPMSSDSGSRASTQVPEIDEGGIIKDTLEMFEDVEQAVTRWRAAERTADELASKSILSLRRGSASDPMTDSADEIKGS
ncbi:hypothetical protein ASPACDRAFT_77729 [Aspergillus aculeatus ATCC 16872]|uniref:Bromo domain-containing protein n=1 Tax=Aspergillus aculeatus (strain ATCC 16872 / CBS 172.66 / WB 5094) TaxID=690307 RepID=A0A1L9WY86_ASPA1|nr:uncharacterized protein ASPACDRAFT_77729 [Aspergillus aculeatus ATCC 16872]OJK00848.1 hypothetical protein ASPACDRAFT_77729 [Aspergillus aculeatus ATCC 16872]